MATIKYSSSAKQIRVWEIDQTLMCSIIGTCLSMEEARRIGKKFGATCDDLTQLDSVIHSMLVRDCSSFNQISVYVDKTLNKKFSGLIKIFLNYTDSSQIIAHWQRLFKEGIISGAYWACVTHPMLLSKDRTRIYSDVHMLSHLVGSSNQSLIKRMVEHENTIKTLEARYGNSLRKMEQKLDEREQRILSLERQMQAVKSNNNLKRHPSITSAHSSVCQQSKLRILRQRCKHLEDEKHKLKEVSDIRLRRLNDTERRMKLLQQDLISLENMTQIIQESGHAERTPDLADKCILYVGGRNNASITIKSYVDNLGGQFIHHTGGSGKTDLSNLPSLIANADAVIVPMDNVSHASALAAKKACKLAQCPFVPLKSSGLGAFASALSQLTLSDTH